MTGPWWRGIGPRLSGTCFQLLLCITVLVYTSVAASTAPGEAPCANGREFALALANPAIATLIIEPEYFEVVDDDFRGLESPVHITRHVAVVGHGARPPIVNLTYISGKVRLAPSASLTFRHLVLYSWRMPAHWQAPGMDILAPGDPSDNSVLFFQNCYLHLRLCFSDLLMRAFSGSSLPRSPLFPGDNTFEYNSTQQGCTASPGAWPTERCWACRGVWVSIATPGYDVDKYGMRFPTGYTVLIDNTVFFSETLASNDCVTRLSPVGCFYSLMPLTGGVVPGAVGTDGSGGGEGGAGEGLGSPQGPAPVLGTAGERGGGGGGDGGDGGGRSVLVPVLTAVLVGSTVLVAASVAVLLVLRRRARQQGAGGLEAGGDDKPGGSRLSTDATSSSGQPLADRNAMDTSSDSAPVAHVGQEETPAPLPPPPQLQQPQAQHPAGGQVAIQAAAAPGPPAHTLVTPATSSAGISVPVCAPAPAPTPAPAPPDAPAPAPAPGAAPAAPAGALAAVLLGGTPPPPPAQPHSTFRAELPSDGGRVAQQILNLRSAPPQIPGDSSPYYTSIPPPHLKATNPTGVPGTTSHIPASANGNTTAPVPAPGAAALDDLPPGPLLASGEVLHQRHQMEAMMAEGMPVTAKTPARADVQMELHWESEELMLLPSARVLGKGSYGRVVEGVYQGQQVAVKLLSAARMPTDGGQDAAANTQQQGQGQQGRRECGVQQQGGAARRPASEQTVAGDGSSSGHQSGIGLRTGEGEEALKEGRESGEGEQGGGAKIDAFQCLKQEVEVLARCEHPNIVRLLAAHLKPPRMCLVLELMDSNLASVIHGREGFLLTLGQVLSIAVDVAKGLEYLHPTIVHRDLKPTKILVSDLGGERPVAKLAGFGLSALRNTVQPATHPQSGTAAYMAPEMMEANNTPITDRADVYSFSVCLWEMLSGREAWGGKSLAAVACAVVEQQQRPPLEPLRAAGRCPPRLLALLEQGWDPVPQRRPAAAEVVKELLIVQQVLQHGADPGVSYTPSTSMGTEG